ncbi:MAG TPA: bifunctional metallophosphatase/5'-nucleotidase [Micromonosporaceae bacterium]|nr:bifunctional metallophosphatase/5'-nucleotidase [Micromonosporaceae bacterium]
MTPSRLSLVAGLLAVGLGLGFAPAASADAQPIDLQLLALNDFHGHLEPGTPGTIREFPSSDPVRAGGAEYLASHIRALEKDSPNSLVVSAGDLIGASPLLSALFHDEPTIEAMNRIGLDLNAVGNHEFDEGAAELLRMQHGGCHPTDGCLDGDGFGGAEFGFLAANVVHEDTGRPLFRPYSIKKVDGVKVGFIGMTLEGTPEIVTPSGVAGLQFLDEAQTANQYAQVLRTQHGVRAIVVLLHEGGAQTAPFGINDCNGVSGPIVDIVDRTTDAVDLFITGHTHQPYNCVIDGRPVTSASSFGRLVTDIDMTLDRTTHDVSSVRVNNRVVTQTVEKANDISALIAKYDTIAAPLRDRVIGSTSAPITRTANPAGESALGDVIADAQLEATAAADRGGAVAAFMNPGGIRADLDAGDVTYGEAFTVQPFGNSLVTMTLTGAQLDTLLEQQWCGQSFPRILQVSAGVRYAWDAAAPVCERVDPTSITIDGVAVDPAAGYRITVNSFLADGGDAFRVLREGTDRLGGEIDLDALDAYFTRHSPVAPGSQDRIARLN